MTVTGTQQRVYGKLIYKDLVYVSSYYTTGLPWIKLYNTKTGNLIETFTLTNRAEAFTVNSNGNIFVYSNGILTKYTSITDPTILLQFACPLTDTGLVIDENTGNICTLNCIYESNFNVVIYDSNGNHLFDISLPNEYTTPYRQIPYPRDICVDNNSQLYVMYVIGWIEYGAYFGETCIQQYDLITGNLIKNFAHRPGTTWDHIISLSYSQNDNAIYTSDIQGIAYKYDIVSGSLLCTKNIMPPNCNSSRSIAVSYNTNYAYLALYNPNYKFSQYNNDLIYKNLYGYHEVINESYSWQVKLVPPSILGK